MKRTGLTILTLAMAAVLCSAAFAQINLSGELGLGYNPNHAGMGETIMKDGLDGSTFELGESAGVLAVPKAIMPQNELKAISKDAMGQFLISDVKDASAMSAVDISLNLRADFFDHFFAKIGLNYDYTMGSTQKYAYGAAVSAYGLTGETVTQDWSSGYWAIPVTLGINIPVENGRYNVYAGLGLTYYSGYWQLEYKAPMAHVVEDDGTPTAAFKEKAKFEISGFGINYLLGADAEVYENLFVFVEYSVTVAADMGKTKIKSDGASLALGGLDNLYYPVNLSKSLFKVGVRYAFMSI